MAGDRIVVEYSAISAAADTANRSRERLATIFQTLKEIGSETLHAGMLDEALGDYQAALQDVAFALDCQVSGLMSYLIDAENLYREVDHYAGTRAVDFDPNSPAPSMVVHHYTEPDSVRNDPSSDQHTQGVDQTDPVPATGTTVQGVPSGPGGSGVPHQAHPPVEDPPYDSILHPVELGNPLVLNADETAGSLHRDEG